MRFQILLFLILVFLKSSCFAKGDLFASLPDKTRIVVNNLEDAVFTTGSWYKIAVNKTGVYRIGYADLQALGINPNLINPQNIKLFGNGGRVLPEDNSAIANDLPENAIEIIGESDQHFDAGDFILFYAQSPIAWNYNASQKIWEHQKHPYSDTAYYFLTFGNDRGKRISMIGASLLPPIDFATSYDYRDFYELEKVNLLKSGRLWLGESFEFVNKEIIRFHIEQISNSQNVVAKVAVAARSSFPSSFSVKSGSRTWNIAMSPIFESGAIYADYKSQYVNFLPTQADVNFELAYTKPNAGTNAWLDFIDITARRTLFVTGNQLLFRDANTVGANRITEFSLQNTTPQTQIWDVSNPVQVKKVESQQINSKTVFTLSTDSLREFVAFGQTLLSPISIKQMPNQNIRALTPPDLLIIATPELYDQALRLATFHTSFDAMDAQVVLPELIYNEFSSGMPDPAAIRNFVKTLYHKSAKQMQPHYLLLFGDGSYDNRNTSGTNLILTYQSFNSLHANVTSMTDDYYGCFDWVGNFSNDTLRIGIGRLPVKTPAEAEIVVDKIIKYATNTFETKNDWRNIVSFIADDDDDETFGFVNDAEALAADLEANNKYLNINKIYLDAYKQQNTVSGQRYPDVNAAITQRVEKGALFINYTGHGGRTGLAEEAVLTIPEIQAWKNQNNLPIFVTATCDFSRFDDPQATSAGELVLLNPIGGGIALFSTTRPTFGTPNFQLNRSLYRNAFSTSGTMPRLGDIIRQAKQETGLDENSKKFVLIGDPALQPAYPKHQVVTTSTNSKPVTTQYDTLKALMDVIIEGKIVSGEGTLLSDFNGFVFPTVFDKASFVKTLGNDGYSSYSFKTRENILYKGKVDVKNGLFSFKFVMPKDIDYQYDIGKISYYAQSEQSDATGYFENIVIGGSENLLQTDYNGPEIDLYLNDKHFRSGGVINNNPYLLAFLRDETGINTTGFGIGHNIVAILDEKTTTPINLNNFYELDANTLKSGSIKFPLFNLEQGMHTFSLKAWDIYNNSSEQTITFEVVLPEKLAIGSARCYPNPFEDKINISIEHNQQGKQLQTDVYIYTITGKPIRYLHSKGYTMGTLSNSVVWDGLSNSGKPASRGVYLCKIVITSETGAQCQIWNKIVYIK